MRIWEKYSIIITKIRRHSMKKILVILICLGILMGSTLTVFAGNEHDPYDIIIITHNM